jgi:hypothetical protein
MLGKSSRPLDQTRFNGAGHCDSVMAWLDPAIHGVPRRRPPFYPR